MTVWAVGLPRLLRTFDDKTRVTGYPLQPAEHSSGSQAVVTVAGPAMAKLVEGGCRARYPYMPIDACRQDEQDDGSWNRVTSLLSADARSG